MSYVSRGETVEALLKQATSQFDVTLESSSQFRSEVLLVRLSGVGLEPFKQHLAEALGGRWRREGNVTRLVLPLEIERAQIAAQRRIRIAEIRQGQNVFRKKLTDQLRFDARTAQQLATEVQALYRKYKGHLGDSPGLEASMALEPRSPSGRMAIAAVLALTPDQIADVPAGGRIVYSTDPTAMQRRLPDSLQPAITRYVAEQSLYSEALKRVMTDNPWGNSSSPLLSAEAAEAPAMVLVSTQRSPYNPALTVQVKLVRKDGTYAGESQTLLDFPMIEENTVPLGDGKIEPSELTDKLLGALKKLQTGKNSVDDVALIEAISWPEIHDPLSFGIADGLFGIDQKDQIIACIPDESFPSSLYEIIDDKGKIDAGRFSKLIHRQCDVHRTAGWLTLAPKRMVEARESRVDRKVVGQFLRQSRQSGGASLAEMADFVDRLPLKYTDTIVPFLAFFVYPELNAGISDRNVEMLRVYGRLTPQQRKDLDRFQSMTVNGLNPESMADLNYLVYRADSPVSIMVRSKGAAPGRFVPSVSHEITYALPKGVPSTAMISLSGQTHDAVMVVEGSSGFAPYQPLSASSLAYALVRSERADPADFREHAHFEKFRFGQTRSVMMALSLTESISISADFHETRIPANGKIMTFDELPESFRKEVQSAMARSRQQAPRNGGGTIKPPPPTP